LKPADVDVASRSRAKAGAMTALKRAATQSPALAGVTPSDLLEIGPGTAL
jgi:hypothetical protein